MPIAGAFAAGARLQRPMASWRTSEASTLRLM